MASELADTVNVLRLLGLDTKSPVAAKVSRFIECNGAGGTIAAAKRTNSELAARRPGAKGSHLPPIEDPWAYTIQVFNHDVAQAGLLYPRLHLLESALRTRVDSAMSASSLGLDWYRDPFRYLERDDAGPFLQSSWDARQSSGGMPDRFGLFPAGTGLLEYISFHWLRVIIMSNYGQGTRAIDGLFGPSSVSVHPPTEVGKRLNRAYVARNLMAHNRPLGNNVYESAVAATNEMLEWLGFDAVKAHRRIVILMGEYYRHEAARPSA